MAKFPVEKTSSARPLASSSSVAACWAMLVGYLRITPLTSGPIGSELVRPAAAATSDHMSLW
jgi:hypothetical protein